MMTNATLTLEGGPELSGEIVDTGADYIRIRATTEMTQEQMAQYAGGLIEIDGKMQKVMLESAIPVPDDEEVIELTMRRFTPSA
ncbi:DUF3237 domain-containing protein [Paracoccus sp. 08]|uniref:DUF3237 domain-containing protein n=1 Tax=Paracoccus sp. 08 TaxID=2606624 RepID=UPI002094F9D0|nr:DUF3237 domain-containing protein [Paracoccus sp. 08]